MATGTDTNHGGRRRNRGRVSGGEVVDITAVLDRRWWRRDIADRSR